MIKAGIAVWLGSLVLLSACNAPEPEKVRQMQDEGRDETSGIRNTENIGYSGDAIADKLDSALDANDRRVDDIDRQLGDMNSSE